MIEAIPTADDRSDSKIHASSNQLSADVSVYTGMEHPRPAACSCHCRLPAEGTACIRRYSDVDRRYTDVCPRMACWKCLLCRWSALYLYSSHRYCDLVWTSNCWEIDSRGDFNGWWQKHLEDTATVSLSALYWWLESDKYNQTCKCTRVSNVGGFGCYCGSPTEGRARIRGYTDVSPWMACRKCLPCCLSVLYSWR